MVSQTAHAAAVAHVDRLAAILPCYFKRHNTTREAVIAQHIANAGAMATLAAQKAAWAAESDAREAANAELRAALPAHELAVDDASAELRLAELSDSLDALPRIAAARRRLAAARCSHEAMLAC